MGTRKRGFLKWPGCAADHSSPPNAQVNNTSSYTSIPLCPYGMVLKYGDNFTFYKITGPIRALFFNKPRITSPSE
jgi:hypothetical protein